MTGSFNFVKCLACVVLFVFVTSMVDAPWLTPSSAQAQDEAEAKPAKKAAEEHSEVEKASFIWWVIETSGPIGVLIFGLSVYFVAMTSRLFLELRPDVVENDDLRVVSARSLQLRDLQDASRSGIDGGDKLPESVDVRRSE